MTETAERKETYNVFEDPDVEFMGEDGLFPSERMRILEKKIRLALYDAMIKYYESIVGPLLVFAIAIVMIMSCSGCAKKLDIPANVPVNIIKVEAADISEEVEVKEEVLEPFLIDGYDFAPYNARKANIRETLDMLEYDEPRVLVSTYYNGCIAILSNNNLYGMRQGNGSYIFFLYLPREDEVESITVNEDFELLNNFSFYDRNVYGITLLHGKDIVGDIPVEATITYKDGSSESIEVLITKDYVN